MCTLLGPLCDNQAAVFDESVLIEQDVGTSDGRVRESLRFLEWEIMHAATAIAMQVEVDLHYALDTFVMHQQRHAVHKFLFSAVQFVR